MFQVFIINFLVQNEWKRESGEKVAAMYTHVTDASNISRYLSFIFPGRLKKALKQLNAKFILSVCPFIKFVLHVTYLLKMFYE